MPSLIRYQKVTCEQCGTQTKKLNLARHKKRCSIGTLYSAQCPNFSAKSQKNLNYHIDKKHSAPKLDIAFKCKLCYAEIRGFYAVCQHKNTQHGSEMGFGASNFDVEDIVADADDKSLKEELESCKHFLTDTEWRMEDTESSTLPSYHSTCLCSTINWIMYQETEMCCKSLDSFWKTSRMESVDTITLARTILLWKELNLCVHKLIWLTWKTECRKWRLLTFVPEKQPIQSGNFTNL